MNCESRKTRLVTRYIVLTILGLIINTPEFKVGIISLHFYHLVIPALSLSLVYFRLFKVHYLIVYFCILVFLFFLILVISGRDQSLIDYANKAIPSDWHKLYAKVKFDDFYRSVLISIFQLANFVILCAYLQFFLAVKLSIRKLDISFLLLGSVAIQIGIATFQYILGEERAFGTLGSAQSLGFFGLLVLCWNLNYTWNRKIKFLSVVLVGVLILLTGTRSSLVIYLLLVFFLFFSFKTIRLISILSLLISFSITMLLSFSKVFTSVFLIAASLFTSPLTLNLRAMMWSSYAEVIKVSPYLGTFGVTVQFTDNLFWMFILPYGILGAGVLASFFYYLFKFGKYSKFITMLIFCVCLQSFSYYGFLISNLGIILFIILGLEFRSINGGLAFAKRYSSNT